MFITAMVIDIEYFNRSTKYVSNIFVSTVETIPAYLHITLKALFLANSFMLKRISLWLKIQLHSKLIVG